MAALKLPNVDLMFVTVHIVKHRLQRRMTMDPGGLLEFECYSLFHKP